MRLDAEAVALAAEAADLVGRVAALGERMAVDLRRSPKVWSAGRVGLLLDLRAAGHSWAEVADELGIDEGAAKVRFHLVCKAHPELRAVVDTARTACRDLRRVVGRARRCTACAAPFTSVAGHGFARLCPECRVRPEGSA